MKKLVLIVLAVPFCMFAERFIVNKKNNTTVDVFQNGEMLNVVCCFPPKDKFDADKNSQLNDQKSERLFIEGLIRYFKAGTNGTMEVSGKHILEKKDDGKYIVYKFAVPKNGCKVVPRSTKSVQPSVTSMSNSLCQTAMAKCIVTQSMKMVSLPTIGMTNSMCQNSTMKCNEMMNALMKQLITNKVEKTINGEIQK